MAFNHDELDQAWPSGKPPPTYDRAGRVALLAEAFTALLDGKLPSRQAALFLGGAIQSWLQQGGSLENDYLQVTAPPGSHHTPAYVWQQLNEASEEASDSDDGAGAR